MYNVCVRECALEKIIVYRVVDFSNYSPFVSKSHDWRMHITHTHTMDEREEVSAEEKLSDWK